MLWENCASMVQFYSSLLEGRIPANQYKVILSDRLCHIIKPFYSAGISPKWTDEERSPPPSGKHQFYEYLLKGWCLSHFVKSIPRHMKGAVLCPTLYQCRVVPNTLPIHLCWFFYFVVCHLVSMPDRYREDPLLKIQSHTIWQTSRQTCFQYVLMLRRQHGRSQSLK